MECFNKARAVKIRSHHGKYLVADDDQQTVRQSRNGSCRKARWMVEHVGGRDTPTLRLKSCHGRYLTASNDAFLLGMTGNKVLQAQPENMRDLTIEWTPERDGFQVKLKAFGGTYLRANGGPPPWKHSVTHDSPYTGKTHSWILWDVEAVDIPENEEAMNYLSNFSSFSSVVSDDLFGSELGSPESVKSVQSPKCSTTMTIPKTGMDFFTNARAVRLRSTHSKYLHADEDEETVDQDRNGASKNARWTVEFVDGGAENIIRLKSCYGRYLTASNQPFLLGMTGHKVLQTAPSAGRLDSSMEWEPIREGNQVRLKTRHGHFLRANGGLPPWRNSVTHDVPHYSATPDWILWDVHVVDIIIRSLHPKPPLDSSPRSGSIASESSSPSTPSPKSSSFGRRESSNALISSLSHKAADGRTIYFSVADEFGDIDEDLGELSISFKGSGVTELIQRLEEETGLEDIVVCTPSPLNGKLHPLRLQLPPNNATMHLVVVRSSSRAARG